MALDLVEGSLRTGKNGGKPPPPGFNDGSLSGLSHGFNDDDDISEKIKDYYRKNVKKDTDQPPPPNDFPNRAYEASSLEKDADQGLSDEDDMALKVDDSGKPSYKLKNNPDFYHGFIIEKVYFEDFVILHEILTISIKALIDFQNVWAFLKTRKWIIFSENDGNNKVIF